MKNIHLIPTDKPSRLYYWKDKLRIGDLTTAPKNLGITNQHIYIASDEEIKEVDWFIHNTNADCSLHKCIDRPSKHNVIGDNNIDYFLGWCKKIILTTDPDLIADGVQAIDDEFLEWFVKNPSCEEVEVERGYLGINGLVKSNETISKDKLEYKIIFPKEPNPCKDIEINYGATIDVPSHDRHIRFENLTPEQANYLLHVSMDNQLNSTRRSAVIPKEEYTQDDYFNEEFSSTQTLEEAAIKLFPRLINDPYNPTEDDNKENRDIWISGAKWQQEQEKNKYSEEEVIQILFKFTSDFDIKRNIEITLEEQNKWFKQFKK